MSVTLLRSRCRPVFAQITGVLAGAGLRHDSHGVSPLNSATSSTAQKTPTPRT